MCGRGGYRELALWQEENNSLRLQVEDLGTKVRRSEMMFARVKDELEWYRIAAGKTPFPNFDEEQQLRSKLQVLCCDMGTKFGLVFSTPTVRLQRSRG